MSMTHAHRRSLSLPTTILILLALVLSVVAGFNPQWGLAIAALVSGGVLLLKPTWALYLFAVLFLTDSFFPSFAIPFVGVKATVSNIIGTIAFFSWALRHLWYHRQRLRWNASLTSLTVFVLWGWVSLLWAADFGRGLTRAVNWIMFLSFYIMFINVLEDESTQNGVMRAMALGAWAALITGLFQISDLAAGGRLRGASYNPNTFGLALVMGMLPVLWRYSQSAKDNLLSSALRLGYLALAVVELVLSGSRGSILGFVFALLVLSVPKSSRRWGVSGLTLVALSILFVPQLYDAVMIRMKHDWLGGREELWPLAWQLFRQRPWLGVGVGNSNQFLGEAFYEYRGIYGYGDVAGKAPHNALIRVALDMGIPGLVLYAAAIIIPVRRFVSQLRKVVRQADPVLVANARTLLAVFSGWLLVWFKHGGAMYDKSLWLFLSLMTVMAQEIKSAEFSADSECNDAIRPT